MSLRLGSPRFWSTALGALAALSFAAAIPLSVLSNQTANLVIAAVIGLPSAGIGVLITRRQPGNPLGWLFLVSAVCQFIGTAGGGYALLAYHLGHHLPLASVAVALDQIWGPSLVVFAVSILLFPDGRLPRFWRWVFRVYCVVFATLLVATAVAIAGALAAHPVRVDESGGLAAVDHPVGWFNAVQGVIIVLILGLSLSFIVRQALTWRRANGERRQQLKWLASGAFVSIVCLIVAGTFGSSSNTNGPTLLGVLGILAWMGVTALPVSIGVGILKYRLYEIDRIISRTLAYAIVTGLLVGASTLVAAALFNPVRRRVQHAVDRRFNRARYDAERMLRAFAARLQDAVDTDAVRADLTGVVHTALEPAHVSVWLRPGGRQ